MSDYPIKWHKTSHGYDDSMEPRRDRESYIYITERGAVEAWRSSTPVEDSVIAPTGHFGGIEVHSKTPIYRGHEVNRRYCEWTRGDCYHDGSSLAFREIEWHFDTPNYIFSILADWAEFNLKEEAS